MSNSYTGSNTGQSGLNMLDDDTSVFGVTKITVSDSTLTDDGNGAVTLTTGGGGGGVTLTGSTNNTVVTVTGADAIAGEANLTFDGAELIINSGTNISGTTVTSATVTGDAVVGGDVVITTGAISHDSLKIGDTGGRMGFFNVSPVLRQTIMPVPTLEASGGDPPFDSVASLASVNLNFSLISNTFGTLFTQLQNLGLQNDS